MLLTLWSSCTPLQIPTQYGIWEFVDLDAERPKELVERLPSISDTSTTNCRRITTGISIDSKRNFRNFPSAIIRTVDSTHVSDLTADYLDPRDILLQLKERLCPVIYSRDMKTLKTQDLEKWTRTWSYVTSSRLGEKPTLLPNALIISVLATLAFAFITCMDE